MEGGIEEKKNSCTKKGTLLGAIIINLATSVISCWGNINMYYLSFFHHQGYSITTSTNSIVILLAVIPMVLFMLPTPYLCNKFGYEFVIKACSIIYFLAPLLIFVHFNFQIFIVCCIIIPTCAYAVSSIPILNCVWSQFPNIKNKITAIVVVAFGVGNLVWNLLFMHLVNPQNKEVSIKGTDLYYFDQSVTKNVQSTSKISYFLSGVLFVVGAILMRKKETFVEEKNQNKPSSSNQNLVPNKTKKQALKDNRFILTFLIAVLIGLFEIYLVTNVKIIYQSTIKDDHFLAYCTIISSIVAICGAFIWGCLGDIKGFSFTVLILAFLDLVIKIYSDFALDKVMVFIMFVLVGITSKSMSTIMGPGLVEIFGLETGTQLLPFKGIAMLLGFIIVPIGQLILQKWISPHEYLIVLSFSSVITVIMSIILYKMVRTEEKKQVLEEEMY